MFLGCTLWFVDFSLSRQYSKANNELDVDKVATVDFIGMKSNGII